MYILLHFVILVANFTTVISPVTSAHHTCRNTLHTIAHRSLGIMGTYLQNNTNILHNVRVQCLTNSWCRSKFLQSLIHNWMHLMHPMHKNTAKIVWQSHRLKGTIQCFCHIRHRWRTTSNIITNLATWSLWKRLFPNTYTALSPHFPSSNPTSLGVISFFNILFFSVLTESPTYCTFNCEAMSRALALQRTGWEIINARKDNDISSHGLIW